MRRELGGHAAPGHRQRRIGRQRSAQRGVQRPALTRQQIIDERLAQQRVAEAVHVVAMLLDEHMMGHRLAQATDQGVAFQQGGGLQQRMANAGPGRRSHPQRGLRIGASASMRSMSASRMSSGSGRGASPPAAISSSV